MGGRSQRKQARRDSLFRAQKQDASLSRKSVHKFTNQNKTELYKTMDGLDMPLCLEKKMIGVELRLRRLDQQIQAQTELSENEHRLQQLLDLKTGYSNVLGNLQQMISKSQTA